jgi:hypothetical protein
MPSGMLRLAASSKFTDVSEVRTAAAIWVIALMTEAVRTSKMSVNFYQTT